MKIAIIGSRNISSIDIGKHLTTPPTLILTGGARGVDTLAAEYATTHGIELRILKPDYKAHKRGAPIRRNELLVQQCDQVLAFWDGSSRGTQFVIDYARKHGKPVNVVMCC